MNVFGAVKQSVTTRQAADLYGVNVRRGGMACCIFHADKTPSMKVDNRYHCFGCQADGDVIDFTAQLFGVGNKQAAEKLAADFGIDYDNQIRAIQKPVIRQLTPEQKLRQETDRCYRDCVIICTCWSVGKQIMPLKEKLKIGIRCLWKPYRKRSM